MLTLYHNTWQGKKVIIVIITKKKKQNKQETKTTVKDKMVKKLCA